MWKVKSEMVMHPELNRNRFWSGILTFFFIATVLAVAFCFDFSSATAAAQDKSTSAEQKTKAIKISADKSEINPSESSMEYSGNVNISVGPTVITADNVQIFFKKATDSKLSQDPESVKKVIADGNVRIVTENLTATCREAVYDAEAKTLVLSGTEETPATLVTDKVDSSCKKIIYKGFTL